jgi:hypothetical protein
MLTIEYPALVPEIERLPMGIIPIVLRNPNFPPKLIVKASKETLLTAKINSGFKIYVVPVIIGAHKTFGLVSAFFDTEDEPLIIYTPIFQDAVMGQLVKMVQGTNLDCHLFDEHSREVLGYACDVIVPEVTRQRLSETKVLPFQLEFAQSAHNQMQLWFALRKASDDEQAIAIDFRESLMPEDLFIMDARPDNHRFPGSPAVSFSELQREQPGAFQEQDIARLLQRLFHPEHIFLNPKRTTDNEEIADLLVITDSELIVVQAKDSPNIERVLRNSVARKKKTTVGALNKAASQVKGALRYIRSKSPLELKVGDTVVKLDVDGLEFRSLIVVKELFNDEYDEYTPLLLDVYKETDVPCVVLDYPELVSYASGLDTEGFFAALDRVFSHGLNTGLFPRLRIWSFPEPEDVGDQTKAEP